MAVEGKVDASLRVFEGSDEVLHESLAEQRTRLLFVEEHARLAQLAFVLNGLTFRRNSIHYTIDL